VPDRRSTRAAAYFDCPAEHWRSIRTTNPIESTFSNIRNRTKLTYCCMNQQDTVTMIFKVGIEGRND